MVYNKRLLGLLVFSIAAIMLLPAGSASTAPTPTAMPHSVAPASLHNAPVAPAADPVSPAEKGAAATESRILASLQSDHIAASKAFLPNFGAHFTTAGNVITPLYSQAPAPMGLGDFGVSEVHGVNVGTISYTQSVEGAVTLNSVNPVYVTSSDPDGFTMQLNTVLTHTDILGSASYQFWIQNVPVYQPLSGTLSFEDNIWNFSSPATSLQANSIYSGDGYTVPGVFYYAIGPSYHVPTPFTVEVYNNATVINDRPTVFFNYTVVSGSGSISGSYDQVEFNSSATPPTSPAPTPSFQINGQSAGPTNFLLNDAEIMLGGPGGGSTTTLLGIGGSMGLWTLPNGSATYKSVASAYDFGTDTGETSEGIAEYATTGSNPVAELNAGPSILYPLWGIKGAHQGVETITVNLAPTNAFVFASVGGKFTASASAWGPTAVSGPTTYWLSPNKYTFEFLLSDYTPVVAHVARGSSATLTVSMSWNPNEGVYTPLWAQSNSQLAAISIPGGMGNTLHPYYLLNNPGTINQLFASFNDYEFPVFPGVYLLHTTDRVNIYDMPSFGVSYPNTGFGSPLSNQLNIELFETTHVSVVDNPDLSGWFYNADSFGEPAAVYVWDSSQTLIAGNTFYVESNGINMVDATGLGGHNVIWGNVFYPTTTVAVNPGAVLNAGNTVGLWEFESNDVIYNNAFLTPNTALSFDENFYTGSGAAWFDTWNVHSQPATNVRVVNGWDLSGDILGLSWVGGNYWNNYGTFPNAYGHPYDNGGLIQSGEDHLPQTFVTLYRVWVHESGLPSGTSWSVTVNGFTESTTGAGVGFWMADGAAYAWSAGAVTGYTATPAVGAVLVSGANAHFTITYT
ncbi:MAG: thermopsin [Thermoplasmata archaeon]|jgi:thermopsin|nr:thermopsin [Thermoplasmata archaeon]